LDCGHRADFYNLSKVHDCHAIGDVPDDPQVMRHEEICETQILLEIAQQIDALSLDRHIQRRDRLVAHHKFRFEDKSASNTDALMLTTRELMGKAVSSRIPRCRQDLAEQRLFSDARRPALPLFSMARRRSRRSAYAD
jgi:hypothetical protein